MRLIENSNTRSLYNKLTEDFWNPCEYAEMIMNLDIDTHKWNEASKEERINMVLPKLEEFWQEYGPEIKRKGMMRRILRDLTDSNFHTEADLLRKIAAKDRRKAKKAVTESITSLSDPDFENTVERDFSLFLMDKYGDELYSDVTEDDVNEYFTGMFYDIWDNDDLDAANEAEKIIRNKYGLTDIRSDDYEEYDDGDTNWAAEEAADADERFENRYMGGGNGASFNESAKLNEDSKIWSNTGMEDYYSNLSREEMIQEIKDNGWDEEEINGKPILDADDEELRDFLTPYDIDLDYEDYENSILPMIENQCYGDYIVLTGIAANWRGKGEACKAIKLSELENYLMPNYDSHTVLYCDNQDNLYYTEATHDTPMGGTQMYLYGFYDETAYNNAEKELQKLFDDEDFDMYYFCDYLGYKETEALIKSGLLNPIKRDPHYVGRVDEGHKLTIDNHKELKEAVVEVDIYTDASDEQGIIKELRDGGLPQSIGIEVKNVSGPAGGNPEVRLLGKLDDIKNYLNNSGFDEDSYTILEESVKTQDFINQVGADNDAKRFAGISGNGDMTLDQYMKYQAYLHDIRKKDTSRYDITIEYWDRNGYPQDKSYVGRSLKQIAQKFVTARDKYDFKEISDYSDNLDDLLSNSECSDMEEYLERIANGETPEQLKLEESVSKKPKAKKEDKRVIMQQGNVTCIKENESYLVFENEADNEVEHDSEESAMQDFLERVGVNPNRELDESIETEESIVGTYEVYKDGNKCNIEVRQFNNDKSKMYAVDNPFKGFEWGTNFYKTKEAVKKFLSKHNAKRKA